ncbi:DUF6760 family protein [Embleya hyalina]|uniref:DUF6760 domain-containing protein n=1 Tax=Embleya hyalina TaxID=516124 RepID=A0A401Z4M4_9ACTN|nr:DUF6760 family protein [Embleya hyalina]GCE01794.1 hypothetical protein EHYA_09568 [Embleya hyalina]
MTHPVAVLLRESARIAGHFHWSRAEILSLAHHERRDWVRQIAELTSTGHERA